MLANEQPSAWILHPSVEKKNVLKNVGKWVWVVTKTSPEIDEPVILIINQLDLKITLPIQRCFSSQMDLHLLPLQLKHWAHLWHATQSLCHSAQQQGTSAETADSHKVKVTLNHHLHPCFTKIQFIKSIACWLLSSVSPMTWANSYCPHGLSQTGATSTLAWLHECSSQLLYR